MRSPLSGPIATLLVFVPLVAVPLIAVFGMPQISAISTSSPGDDLKFAIEKAAADSEGSRGDLGAPVEMSRELTRPSDRAEPRPAASRRERPTADPFAEFSRSSEPDASPDVDSGRRGSASPKRLQSASIDEGNGLLQRSLLAFGEQDTHRSESDGSNPDRSGRAPVRSKSRGASRSSGHPAPRDEEELHTSEPPADERRTEGQPAVFGAGSDGWKKVVAKLNALGIRDFQLQPGLREGEFHFSCRFVARDNPRVIRRFEAEAAEPLEAAEKVLRQIDEWRAQGRSAGAGGRDRSPEPAPKVTATDPFENR